QSPDSRFLLTAQQSRLVPRGSRTTTKNTRRSIVSRVTELQRFEEPAPINRRRVTFLIQIASDVTTSRPSSSRLRLENRADSVRCVTRVEGSQRPTTRCGAEL